jgi:ketosteroid isomerase-like protein
MIITSVMFLSCDKLSDKSGTQNIPAVQITNDSLAQKLAPFNQEIEKAMYAADYEKLLTFYCDDVVIKSANRKPVVGIAAVREGYDEQKKLGVKILSFKAVTERLWAAGDEVFEYGTYAMSVTHKNTSEPKAYTGSYFLILKAYPGDQFKIKYMLDNLDFIPHD